MPAEVETMFYYGEVPWHGLGTKVDHALTAEEAITAAGLDWEVELAPVYQSLNSTMEEISGRSVVRRKTDGRVLSIMTPHYSPVQNKQAFGFFDSVVGTGDAKYHTAGSLRGGQRVWVLANLNGSGSISIKGDEVEKYLLLMNGHDGSFACKMFFTPIRVVCMNTLAAAESRAEYKDKSEIFYAAHVGDISSKLEQARMILGFANRFYDEFTEKAIFLASHQLPPAEFPKLLAAAFGTTGAIRPEDVVDFSDFGSTHATKEMEKVQVLFEGSGKGLDTPAIKGTKWAAYNAIVEYVDYAKKTGGKDPLSNRLSNVWTGDGMKAKSKAWNYLVSKQIS